METKSVLFAGVGGQGAILTAKVLVNGLMRAGYDVKVSEVHGMSQRGGSVVTYVKYGEQVNAPIIDKGEADIILAFERLEALRALPYLRKGGKIILNDRAILPMPVITGAAEYPQNILGYLGERADLTALDALKLSEQAGSAKAVNVVLIGVLAQSTNINYAVWQKIICETVPEKFKELNLRAFDLGYHYH